MQSISNTYTYKYIHTQNQNANTKQTIKEAHGILQCFSLNAAMLRWMFNGCVRDKFNALLIPLSISSLCCAVLCSVLMLLSMQYDWLLLIFLRHADHCSRLYSTFVQQTLPFIILISHSITQYIYELLNSDYIDFRHIQSGCSSGDRRHRFCFDSFVLFRFATISIDISIFRSLLKIYVNLFFFLLCQNYYCTRP